MITWRARAHNRAKLPHRLHTWQTRLSREHAGALPVTAGTNGSVQTALGLSRPVNGVPPGPPGCPPMPMSGSHILWYSRAPRVTLRPNEALR
jgi:hypothetical protein